MTVSAPLKSPVIRTVDVIISPRPTTAALSRRRPIVVSFTVFVLLVVAVNLALAVALEHGPPHLRDPEYGLRLQSLRERQREDPHRPLTVILGSSRTAQGLRPDVYEQAATDESPLLFNLSQSGGGPLLQLLTLRRLLADGVRPAAAVVEFWPPFLRGDAMFREQDRISPSRLRNVDEPTVRQFFVEPEMAWTARHGDSFVPLIAHRRNLLTRLCPDWLPQVERTDEVWRHLDGWGWWPGRITATPEQIAAGWPTVEGFYGPMYITYHIDPTHDRAYRTLLAECQTHGIRVTLVRMPESPRFRSLQIPQAVEMYEGYLSNLLTEYRVPVIDGRDWADPDHLPDGFHLTQAGATEFTRRFASAPPRPTTNSTPPGTVSRP